MNDETKRELWVVEVDSGRGFEPTTAYAYKTRSFAEDVAKAAGTDGDPRRVVKYVPEHTDG